MMTYVHDKPATLTKANLEYLAHHIFLPTKLPGGDDSSAKNEILMVNFVLDTLVRFMGECTSEDETAIEACVAMIKGLKISKSAQGSLSANDAQEVLRHLSPQAPVALLHIAAQNGGVLVRKTITSAILETFELSPANKAVMTTQGRLVRQFPANATEIRSVDFEDETFLSVFTKTLEKMSYQTVQETVHKARKAEQEHDEDRETVEPRIVTDLLPSMLRGVGKQVAVPGICKNTREEVMWSNSKLPWRRSPVWFLIRVGLQLTMTRLARKDKDPYKEFMVFLMAQVLDVAVKQGVKSDMLHTMSTKLSRRLCKLKYRSNGRWLQSIQQIVSEASKCLARRWDRIRKREEKLLELNDLRKPEMEDNLHFSLLKMEEFLTSIPERGKHIEFPNFIPISHVRPIDGNDLPTYTAGDETYLPFRLAMIESWEDETFLSVFTKTLEKMSYQTVQETVHKARKAEQEHDEDRETVEPRIVTDLLPSMLRGVGKQVAVPGICKNTREEVMWSNSKLPWRRSPVWFLIRVGLQLTMTRLARKDKDPYKEFMVFLMAQVLDVAVKQGVKSDMLHTMSTKLSRRLCKLKYRSNGRWLQSIQQIVSEASKCLARRWDRIRKREEKLLELNDLRKPEMEDNLHFSLLKMEEFLTSIPERGKHIEFPNFIPISHVRPIDGNDLPTYTAGDETYLPFRLAMIESWVAANLDTWLNSHIEEENLCGDLKRLVQSYHSEASRWYSSRPEGASRMLLTIGELWVAADKAAIHALPMLRCYEHEVPTEVWQTLLLASMADMERLHSLEAYLLNRQRVAQSKNRPSIFRSYGHRDSFPVQYFSGSVEHQQLKAEIEERALAQRQAKIEELRRLKKEYETLMQRFNDAKCDEYPQEEYGITVWRHSYACVRHGYLSKANNLQIQVHEWPLPNNNLGAQATVFELAVPPIFSEWRDITLYLINDVLLSQPSGVHHPNPSYSLRAYQPLDKFFRTRRDYRIHLVSEAKPNVVTHRRDKPIQYCTDSDVCVNNGLRYQYYDGNQNCFLEELLPTEGLLNLCTFDLPKRAQALKRFLVRTWLKPEGETPNEVIASQSDCPEYLSLSEYKVLAELPYGYNIQWMSILTQLAMPKIDFNKTETAIFLLQMSLQAGPRSSTSTRCTHLRLKDQEFGHQMLEHLTKGVSHIQENWESYTALSSYTLLASRLLSQVPSELSHAFLGLLEKCRRISYRWLMTILGRVQETTSEIRRSGFLKTALTIALICGDSFNVYDGFLPVILADAKQASMLIECSIIIYNNASLTSETETTLRGILFDRWNYTMNRVCAILVEQNHLASSCLDLAIRRYWPAFQPTASWTLAAETSYWFETMNRGHLQVHYNILTGELLVNGLPLTRLPEQYERHDDYERLFGSLILNVMPSNLPGMRFCTTQQFEGHIVHFGMQGQDLLVRLEVNESYLDLIPSRTLRDMLPHFFVNDYAHWYHNEAGIIQLRSLKDPWTSNPDDWCFVRQDGGWKLCQGGRTFLFAPSSSMARHIAGILSPLEAPLGLHMLYDARKSALEVRVPSLRLDFLLTAGESIIRSRQFRGMYIDSDQSVGTLVGFKSKLVLCNDQNPSVRIVLIPEGDIQFQRFSGHVTVNAAYGTADRVQAYRIDDLLGRLTADTKLESKLYLAYIHALTSFCLPDPFLRRTGTEEALHILGSASVRAPCLLSWTAHDRLNLIAALAPRRAFYPAYEKVMQKVDWSSNLGFLAQDDRLYAATKEILGRCSKIGFLYPHHNIEQSEIIHNTVGLVERAILRNSRQCVSGFGAEDFTVRHDVAYQSRERDDSGRAERATEMAFRAYNKLPTFSESLFADFSQHLYALLSSESTISDRAIPPREDMLYDSNWLKNPTNFLSSYWCRLHHAFQHNHIWLNKFELMVWIATVAYSAESDNQVTQALLLLALSTSVSTIPLPPDGQYDLSLGYNMKATELESIARIAAFRYEQTPAARLEPRLGESWQQTWNRRHREYQSETKIAAELFKEELARQWPCRRPRASSDGRVTAYINVSKAMASVVREWTKWYSNRQFAAYLTKLAKGLGEVPVDGIITEPPSTSPDFQPTSRSPGFVSIDDLFHHVPPSPTLVPDSLLEGLHQATWTNPSATARLPAVLDVLDREAKLDYEHHYLRELRQSLASLKGHAGHKLNRDRVSLCADLFQKHLKQCNGRVESIYGSLLDAVNQDLEDLPGAIQRIVEDTGFRPRISPILFLQQLRSSRWSQLPSAWQDAIIEYGQVITALQQAKRLIRFQNDPVDLLRELESSGHRNWNPREHPEWLLLECESEILIRDVQQQIAQKMIQPPENKNAVMQLNMGEGKSSVIVPSVAAALGDGSKLIRVIVAKPQAKQLHQMLTSKLSDNEALFTAFDLLIRSDNADLEYQEWVKASPTIPDAFKHIQGVNLKDHVQCVSEVFPCIKYSKAAIDYYLCRMVFAKESREFPHKLSASGWDLGKQKQNPTTGFSGTNDSRYVLPLDMKQLDIPEQKHTNALVLEYLLQPENAIALVGPEVKGAALDSRSLLDMVINMDPNTRVILDVGAQVIEYTNLEFSKEWLKCYKDEEYTQAAIFFNDSDEIMVLDRSGKVEELQTSPFADQLDQCLIFLDEAHTRGTDLRLPANYRAAVTLGANLTKDRLVQACMRMRKLGKGQTVIFCIPREIEQKILQLLGQESSGSYNITVADVLCWAIKETCQNMRRELPLWFTQGIRFCQQRSLWDEMEACSDYKSRSKCAGQFKEDEAQSLGQRYHPQQAHPNIYSFLDRIEPCTAAEFRKRCQEFGLTELRTSTLQGEQERELSPETEHERQVERPLPAEPEIHHLHEDVCSFVLNGVFSQSSSAFKPAFMALEHTSAAKNFDVSEFRNHVWATQDFARTVKGSFELNNYADSFQRSVQWVLTNEREIANNRLLVISPYEAQYLLPDIETSQHVTLRLYSSRVNLGFESLDHLTLFTIPQTNHDNIPRGLITQLNVFAGQLYLSSYSDYVQMCDSLGLAWKAPDESIALGPDGFLPPNSTGSSFSNNSGLSRSPVGFLKVLMSIIRQECELIGRTHMGRILEGVRLHEEEWIETQN
ncbi:hypothetical protein FOWG_17578 [Fusarium oxysporum f. sp. lycopersici MN25]|nr:hypothetical protein FOWG_17578 [Fusarium oxysporum f. sp. lycopersici MN25]